MDRPAPLIDPDDLAWLRLARSRNVGSVAFQRLLSRFGSAAEALAALPDLAAKGGAKAYQACSERQGVEEMERAAAIGAAMVRLGGPGYPPLLAEIPDPPPVLWRRGDPALLTRPAIAIVGARNASSLGMRMARTLARDLGERGWVVVSGFARGIDAAAHGAALETGTVAAMAGGVDIAYPAQNAALLDRMAESGALLSEAPPGLQPQARHFPRRNRVVSGLARGVVLIEAAARSGSLITARFALEQGRETMAVPGAPLDPRAAGCNALIRQGAALIRSADDVEEALEGRRIPLLPGEFPPEDPAPPLRAPDETLLARARALLGPSPIETDALARDLGASAADLAEALLELELAGVAERRAGGLVALAAEG